MNKDEKILEIITAPLLTTFINVYEKLTKEQLLEVNNEVAFTPVYCSTMGLNGLLNQEGTHQVIEGGILIIWDIGSYLDMSSRMLGTKFESFCEDIDDVGLETLNITVGNTKPILRDQGIKLHMSIPMKFQGTDLSVSSFKSAFSKTTFLKDSNNNLIKVVTFSANHS